MPGIATPQLLNYAEIVDVDLDATNDVNFADVEDYGHRVVVEMNTTAANNYLAWRRPIGTARPVAMLNTLAEAAFRTALVSALNDTYVDIDGVTGGLHFGTANLSTNPDPRIRKDAAVSANDLPLCFVLYKLYGSSAATTLDRIYNLEDAYEMLSSETVADSIVGSLKAQESGAVDTMFRDLVSADPHRFFDASGLPIVGMYETNQDVFGSGSWKLVADDTLEIKLKMIFHSRVTRRGVAGQEHNLTTSAVEDQAASQANQQTIIKPDDYFYVRLQLKMAETSVTPGPTPPPGPDTMPFNIVGINNGGNAGPTDGTELVVLANFSVPAVPSSVFEWGLEWVYPSNMPGYALQYDALNDYFYIKDENYQMLTMFTRPNTSTKVYTATYDVYNRAVALGQFTITRA